MKTINFAVSEHNSRVYSLIFLGDNMKFKKYATKTLMIVIGSIISAYGITLAIGAGFGGATLAILWQGLTAIRMPTSVLPHKRRLPSPAHRLFIHVGQAPVLQARISCTA